MLKSYKTEIDPTPEQKHLINRTIGTCRYVYNFYLAHNKETYEAEKRFVSGMDFSKWLNNVFIPNNPEFIWIKDVSSKSIKHSIMNADKAFRNFFNGKAKFPKFKKKNNCDVKMYFVKTDSSVIIPCERHRIKIPTLGWVRLKEKGYIPTKQIIKSGSVSYRAGRYYVSVLVDEEVTTAFESITDNHGVGVDLGIKSFATCSNGTTIENINKSKTVRYLERKLKREQHKLSRKYESYKERNNNLKGEATRQNIQKQVIVVQKLHHRLDNIRTDYANKAINDLVKTNPSHISIEDLNVKGMMKNRHLAKSVAQQKFGEYRINLTNKCNQEGIELRIVNRFFPSSKLCHNCGSIKSTLKLSDRMYVCECGYSEDRDINASLNLRDSSDYRVV